MNTQIFHCQGVHKHLLADCELPIFYFQILFCDYNLACLCALSLLCNQSKRQQRFFFGLRFNLSGERKPFLTCLLQRSLGCVSAVTEDSTWMCKVNIAAWNFFPMHVLFFIFVLSFSHIWLFQCLSTCESCS